MDPAMFEVEGWTLEKFDADKLVAQIRLKFSNPIQISQGSSYDTLNLLFKSEDFQVALEPKSQSLSIPCPKQSDNSSFNISATKTAQSQSSFLLVILIVSIVIYLMSQGDK